MRESLELYGHSQPRVAFTDNPAADKPMLLAIFNSLERGVVPVEKYPTLKPFSIPEGEIIIMVYNTPTTINGACNSITDDLDPGDESAQLITGFDAEWNVNMTAGGGPEPTSVVQIAYKKRIYIFQVCYCLALFLYFNLLIRTHLDWSSQRKSSCRVTNVPVGHSNTQSWSKRESGSAASSERVWLWCAICKRS